MKVKVAQLCPTSCDPMTMQSMEFSRPEYWSGFPCPPPGGSSQPRDQSTSPVSPTLAGGFFITTPPGKSMINLNLSFLLSPSDQESGTKKTSLGPNCV